MSIKQDQKIEAKIFLDTGEEIEDVIISSLNDLINILNKSKTQKVDDLEFKEIKLSVFNVKGNDKFVIETVDNFD